MKRFMVAMVFTTFAAAACGDSTGLGAGERAVSLSFTTTQPAGAAFAATRPFFGVTGDTVVSGTDMIIIDRVRMVLREIELKRVEDQFCEDSSGEGEDNDDCEEFEIGPLLLDLPLNGMVETEVSVVVDTGTYDEIEFDIHKPSDDSAADSAFRAANPLFTETSIRVEGSFNGQPFVYETDLNVDQEIELTDPLIVTDQTAATNVTLSVALDVWFRDASGALVDPETGNKGSVNENLIKDNIKDSFEAFEDEDRDGDDDDGDDS